MKIGTQTGSLTNHLLSHSVIGQPEPEVGMGATILGWTDRKAGTITEVFLIGARRAVTVQEDRAIRTDTNGMSECQTYSYERNPEGWCGTWRQAANGQWEEVYRNPATGRWVKRAGNGLRIGAREAYHDFSF